MPQWETQPLTDWFHPLQGQGHAADGEVGGGDGPQTCHSGVNDWDRHTRHHTHKQLQKQHGLSYNPVPWPLPTLTFSFPRTNTLFTLTTTQLLHTLHPLGLHHWQSDLLMDWKSLSSRIHIPFCKLSFSLSLTMFCSYRGAQITQVVFFNYPATCCRNGGLSEVYLKDFMSMQHKWLFYELYCMTQQSCPRHLRGDHNNYMSKM